MGEAVTGKQLGLTAVKGRILVPTEIAAFLRVSVRWVEMHMTNGTFPLRVYPIGPRGRGVDSEDLNAWLEKIRVEAGTALLPAKAVDKIQKEEVYAS